MTPPRFPFRLGDYQILNHIGAGGMGTTYRAEDKEKRLVCIKQINRTHNNLTRIEREFAALMRMTSPYVARGYGSFGVGVNAYLVQELIDGPTIWEYREELLKTGSWSLKHSLKIGIETAIGLNSIHQCNILHRDIKPSNILIQKCEGRVKIVDFGIAKEIQEQSLDRASSRKPIALTQAGQLIGTPVFASPEQARSQSGHSQDARSDLYSLGVLLFYLISGEVPYAQDVFQKTNMDPVVRKNALIDAKFDEAPQKLNQIFDVPEPLSQLIDSMLALEKSARPSCAAEVAMRLTEIKNSIDHEEEVQALMLHEHKALLEQFATLTSDLQTAHKKSLEVEKKVSVLEFRLKEANQEKERLETERLGLSHELETLKVSDTKEDTDLNEKLECLQTNQDKTHELLSKLYKSVSAIQRTTQVHSASADKVQEDLEVEELIALGDIAMKGNNTLKKDPERAFYWYQRASKSGNASALRLLGDCYFNGTGVEISHTLAIDYYKKAVDLGDAAAMDRLGDCYWSGHGFEKNLEVAFDWYLKAAKLGNPSAMNTLGDCYYSGIGVEQNYKAAVEWFQKAAKLGNTPAMNRLGCCYDKGNGVDQNYKAAVEWFQKAAKLDNTPAMNNLAHCYYIGNGVKQNYQTAVEWFQKAAEYGVTPAMYGLGDCYYSGNGVEQNYKAAVEWFRKAARRRNFSAMYRLGDCYYSGNGVEQNYKAAVEWFRRAARHRNSSAMNGLGDCYYHGNGVEQNYKTAIEMYRNAIELGHSLALNNLGTCFFYGHGVEQNYKTAVKWFQKGAKLGISAAMHNMGICYYNGNGVKQNYKAAVGWFQKAAKLGNASATNELGLCYYLGNGVEQNYKTAVEWYQKAIKLGSSFAMVDLGTCFFYGHGVEQSYEIAVKWFQRAANRGNSSAMNKLGLCYYEGKGVEQNYETAVQWYQKAADLSQEDGLFNLANCYHKGQGVERNLLSAIEYYQKAADLGHEEAKAKLDRF